MPKTVEFRSYPPLKVAGSRQYRVIDLFAGAGGMTVGFVEKGFKPVWANDYNKYAADTYNANFGEHCIVGDIADLIYGQKVTIPKADVVIGGPPCQGFSLLNKNREGDSRRQLWRPFLEVVRLSGADVFVMENVPQLLDSDEHQEIVKVAEAMGFKLTHKKLCAANYGVPQVRWRAFIVGCRFGDPTSIFPPKASHYSPKGKNVDRSLPPWRTVRDVIADLPPTPNGTEINDEEGPLDLHFGRNPTTVSLKRYRMIPNEGDNRFTLQANAPELTPACWIRKTSGGTDLFGRLWWDRPALTIRTEFFKPEKGRYLHPKEHRPITHREAARLQSFPDGFKFKGSKIEVAKQIGNAVPPLLAEAVAQCVLDLLAVRDEARDAGPIFA
jgi:DNA (cytosine-5)-methyltransferase 1